MKICITFLCRTVQSLAFVLEIRYKKSSQMIYVVEMEKRFTKMKIFYFKLEESNWKKGRCMI